MQNKTMLYIYQVDKIVLKFNITYAKDVTKYIWFHGILLLFRTIEDVSKL